MPLWARWSRISIPFEEQPKHHSIESSRHVDELEKPRSDGKAYRSKRTMEITVMSKTTNPVMKQQLLSKFDRIGDWVDESIRIGEIYMTNVADMVLNVLARAGSNQITRLNIVAHGTPATTLFGNDLIDVNNFSRYEPTLLLLRGRFARTGFVHMQICELGQNFVLLTFFARAFGVPVIAGAGDENTIFRFNWKKYVRCDPSGSCRQNLSRP